MPTPKIKIYQGRSSVLSFQLFFKLLEISVSQVSSFLITHVKYTPENCSVWKIINKTCLVMVTITELTQQDIGNCNIQNCFEHPNGLDVSNEN